MASWNVQEYITVKSIGDFARETMITLIVMTSEAIRFEDLQNCFNVVLNGHDTGLLWNNFVSELVRNWNQFFGRAIPVTCEMLQENGQAEEDLKTYFRTFCCEM